MAKHLRHFWLALSLIGIYVCGVYRRELYTPQADKSKKPPSGVSVVLGTPADLELVTQQQEYELTSDFVASAFAQGHAVVLTYVDDILAAYGWVSYTTTPHLGGWWIEFAPGHRYNYNNFTLPRFRGQHLRGSYGVLQELDRQHQARHSIAFIDLRNIASRRAEKRNGGIQVGYAGYINLGPLKWSMRSPGARKHGFRFVHR